MNYQNEINSNYYLARFNEILYNMQKEMLISTTTTNISIDFIRCMIPHNQAKIYMCENLQKYTNNNILINISNNIIKIQNNQIEIFKQIQNSIIPYYNSDKEIHSYFKKYFKIVNNMIYNMKNSQKGINIDLDFISEIIFYNESTIKLCQNVSKYNIDYRLRNLVTNIIIEQTNEINSLKQIERGIIKK